MKYIASCSFGKDSLAMVILAKQYGEPLDEVVYCEVMFDEKVSGEIPEHIDFINNIPIPKLDSWGIKTIIVKSHKTYVSSFTREIKRGKIKGKIKGFPLCGLCHIQRDCKVSPLEAYRRSLGQDVVQYIGIAKDETERLLRLDGVQKVSLLDKYNITEENAKDLCVKHGLLSPIYEFTNRGGCWFCPNAKMPELLHLYEKHPDLWARMLELQQLPNKATDKFNRKYRFDEIDMQMRAPK